MGGRMRKRGVSRITGCGGSGEEAGKQDAEV